MPAAPPANPSTPWERQQGEGLKAHQAFLAYRDQPAAERSYRSVGEQLGKSRVLIETWGSNHRWQERVAAYDAYVEAQREEAARRAENQMSATMGRRHAQMARALQQKGLERLRSLDVNTMGADEVARFIKLGADIERLALGHSTANVHVIADVAINPQSIDEQITTLFMERRAAIEAQKGEPPRLAEVVDTDAEEA